MIYDFIQSDYRWAYHPYAGENMAVAGCGPTSVADVTGQLPPNVADWLTNHGYASNGQGTYWSGITPACEAFGFSAVQLNSGDLYGQYNTNVEKNWLNQMKTGKYYGILLMGRGYFCSSGHFIAIKEVNDNNSAYALDVAYSPRSGWHEWSTYQGAVKVFYLVENKDAIDEDKFTFTTQQIKLGNYGIDVWRLQMILKARGYYEGKIDKLFGKQTQTAVINFQKKAGLVQDGICGPMTWATLLGLGSIGGRWIVDEVKLGETKNKSVLLCQEFLKASGYYEGDLDWSFGYKTKEAVEKFQKAAKLKVNGVFDKATARHMIGDK